MWLYIGGSALSAVLVVAVVVVAGPRFLSRKPVDELPIRRVALVAPPI